jgi:hypothetical protein
MVLLPYVHTGSIFLWYNGFIASILREELMLFPALGAFTARKSFFSIFQFLVSAALGMPFREAIVEVIVIPLWGYPTAIRSEILVVAAGTTAVRRHGPRSSGGGGCIGFWDFIGATGRSGRDLIEAFVPGNPSRRRGHENRCTSGCP